MNIKDFRTIIFSSLIIMLGSIIFAHMNLEKTEPVHDTTLSSQPQHLQMWFTQEPDLTVTKVELKGQDGIIELGEVHLMGEKTLMAMIKGNMSDGTYTVNWQTAGDDGHIQKGEFVFQIGQAEN